MAIYTFELFTRTSHGSLLKVLGFLNGNSSKIILRLILKNVFLLFIYFFLWSWNNAFFMNYSFNHSDIISVKHWGQQKTHTYFTHEYIHSYTQHVRTYRQIEEYIAIHGIFTKTYRYHIFPVRMSPVLAVELLFFAIFGQTTHEQFKVEITQPEWTKVLFKLTFGIYMLVSVVVLINLLIAMMSDTYQRIQAQSDIEWKYGLSKLVRNMHR